VSSGFPNPPFVPSSGTSLSETSPTSGVLVPSAKPIKPILAPSIHPMLTRLRAKSLAQSPPHALVSYLEPSLVSEALLDSRWVKTMEDEYRALEKNHTWVLVPFSSDMNLIGNKWIFRIKYNSDRSILKYKARLVAKGFLQNSRVDYADTFSPVVKAPTIRVLFSLVVQFGWEIISMVI